jgi:hypothetical protein
MHGRLVLIGTCEGSQHHLRPHRPDVSELELVEHRTKLATGSWSKKREG